MVSDRSIAAALPRWRVVGLSLPMQMLVGLFVGCALGFLWPAFGKELFPVSRALINALRMLIIPLVFSSIVLGIYHMGREIRVFGKVVGIAFVWFYVATGTCLLIGLLMNAIFHPGIGVDLTMASQAASDN
jgi:DAACS family dicarboxylate/amino acid:cation (Na+ or H+) symporter